MNRVIVITGGNSGIGKAMAAIFAQNGDQVVIIGRREEALRAAAAEIGSNCDWQSADVSQRQPVEAAVRAIAEKFGKVDVLIINARYSLGMTTEMSLVQAEQVCDEELGANLKCAFLMKRVL
jgi:3-oxoacyl-[acyl-carrier protein] reductase